SLFGGPPQLGLPPSRQSSAMIPSVQYGLWSILFPSSGVVVVQARPWAPRAGPGAMRPVAPRLRAAARVGPSGRAAARAAPVRSDTYTCEADECRGRLATCIECVCFNDLSYIWTRLRWSYTPLSGMRCPLKGL